MAHSGMPTLGSCPKHQNRRPEYCALAGNGTALFIHVAKTLKINSAKQGLGPEEQAVLVQCICLKMLTDFTLMYTSAIGLVLRRDADCLAVKQSPRAKTPGKAPKQPGVLLKSVSLCIHLLLSA